jgi:hypothetical protein
MMKKILLTTPILIILLLQCSLLFAEPPENSNFQHSLKEHVDIKCSSCHSGISNSDQIRPAKNSHTICSDSGCHNIYEPRNTKDLFNPFCLTCHTKGEPWSINADALKPFPAQDDKNQRDFCVKFDHKSHLSDEKNIAQQECLDCHLINTDQKTRENPQHAQCIECHEEKHSKKIHSIQECDQCHQIKKIKQNKLCTQWTPVRRKISKFFKHEKHLIDIRVGDTAPLSCGVCHPNIINAKNQKYFDILSPQAMSKACDECHNGKLINPSNKKPVFSVNAGQYCSKCHGNQFNESQIKQGHKGVW